MRGSRGHAQLEEEGKEGRLVREEERERRMGNGLSSTGLKQVECLSVPSPLVCVCCCFAASVCLCV
jgi:hypothetical protein